MFRTPKESFDYLNSRGYNAVVGAFQSQPGFMVNGIFLMDEQICVLATYEHCKDESAKPDGLALEYMANACLKIANHPSLPSLAADQGRDLAKRFEDWKNPEIDVPQAQLRVLCKRMAHYLTSWFGYLWPSPDAA